MGKQRVIVPYEELMKRLESKRKSIDSGDFRFYNMARLPLVAKHSYENAKNCRSCKFNLVTLEDLVNSLPDCMHEPATRRNFENKRDQISRHLQKIHKINFVNYHYSLFTLVGLMVGAALGIAVQFIFQHRLWALFAMAGALAGAIYGKRTEKRRWVEKRLM